MDLIALLSTWGLPLVFGVVLAEQSGLPLPAAPLLVSAGALGADGVLAPELVWLAAFAACQCADHGWFLLGRRYGRRLLAGLCRVSLSPDTCVRRTDTLIARHGAPVLLLAKFIPGVSAVVIPTSASMGMAYRRFLGFNSVGIALWVSAYVAVGMVFAREVNALLVAMSWIGGWAIGVLAAALAAYIGWKLLVRQRLKRLHRRLRIDPDELAELLLAEPGLMIVDARTPLSREADPRTLPNAVAFDEALLTRTLAESERDQAIVTFCVCPNEASAALVAQRLMDKGYRRVRVLTGGGLALDRFAVERTLA